MSEKFQNQYRIKSARLENWDYGSNAAYFVTICTQDRAHYFGEITDGIMQLSEIGFLAYKYWLEISEHFPFVELDEFVVMPNHVHGIIIINKPVSVETRHALSLSTQLPQQKHETIGQKRFQNQGKETLSSIIGSYKSVLTKNARKIHADFAWQARFHDHIIRNDQSFYNISDYIKNNPSTWKDDKFHAIR
ncbi:transposase [Ancylomarina sp. YFZ004]